MGAETQEKDFDKMSAAEKQKWYWERQLEFLDQVEKFNNGEKVDLQRLGQLAVAGTDGTGALYQYLENVAGVDTRRLHDAAEDFVLAIIRNKENVSRVDEPQNFYDNPVERINQAFLKEHVRPDNHSKIEIDLQSLRQELTNALGLGNATNRATIQAGLDNLRGYYNEKVSECQQKINQSAQATRVQSALGDKSQPVRRSDLDVPAKPPNLEISDSPKKEGGGIMKRLKSAASSSRSGKSSREPSPDHKKQKPR